MSENSLREALARFTEATRDYVLWADNPTSMGVQGPNAQGYYQLRQLTARSRIEELFDSQKEEIEGWKKTLATSLKSRIK